MSELSSLFMDDYNARLAASGGDWTAMNTYDIDAAYHLTLNVFPANVASSVVEASEDRAEERSIQCQLLRCIFGNPFQPVEVDPLWLAWNDGTLRQIARTIYDDRAWDQMPILGDALEDAGCTREDVLSHCTLDEYSSPAIRTTVLKSSE